MRRIVLALAVLACLATLSACGTSSPATAPSGATLGGPDSAFTSQFGQPVSDSTGDSYQVQSNGVTVTVGISTDQIVAGSDGVDRVKYLQLTISPVTDRPDWPSAVAPGIYGPFLPSDAHMQTTQQFSDQYAATTEVVYWSGDLAAAFPASTVSTYPATRVGTFSVTCSVIMFAPNGSGSCGVGLGDITMEPTPAP